MDENGLPKQRTVGCDMKVWTQSRQPTKKKSRMTKEKKSEKRAPLSASVTKRARERECGCGPVNE